MLNKKKYLLLFFVLFAHVFMAANLTKGFEALSIHDYFKAKKIFEQGLKKQTPAAAYGLSIIYSLNNNPFYNLDSALFYVNRSETSFALLSSKQKTSLTVLSEKKWKNYKIDSLMLYAHHQYIDEKCFVKAKEENTIESFNYFLKQNVNAKQQTAISLRNQLAFSIAKTQNTSVAYLHFLETYPNAIQYNETKALYDKRIFEEHTELNTLENNQKFINDYPENPYVNKAHQNI
ncbi:MAG TPA: hypothetical protein PK649_13535, partial [Vicingus sp.]|nr:hypothetical protein [Vicingus sp.]